MQRIKFRKGLALLLAFIMAFTMVMPAVASDYTPEAPAATDVSSGENVGENHGYADTEDGNEENAIEDGHVQGYCGEYDCACIEDDQYALFYISQENIEALDIVEPTPNFEALLPLLGAGDAADWTYHFGTGFPAGDVWNFVPLALGTLNANTLAEEIAGTAWNNFLQVDVPNQGGRRYTHANLPTPIADAHQAFVTFDLRPGNATPGGGVARNFVDHALMIGDNPFLVIRNQQGRMIASGEVPVAGNYWDGELTSYTVLSSITENRADWRNTWFTFGIVLNFISGEAVISVIERGAFDGVAWTYGAVLGTYTVPIAGSSFDGFRIRTQRDSGNNITFTGHGFDNLHFFSGEMPVEWEQIGQTIDFADGIPGAVTNSQIVYTQQFAGQTVLNANPMATYPAATWGNSTGQWALPLTSGAWDIGDNNMVRIEFDFWTEWNRQHTLGWEARFNFDDGTTPFAGTLFGVRGTSNGSHPAGPNQNTHLRIVTSENDQANNTRHSAADIIRSGIPRHTLNRVILEANLVTQTGQLIVLDAGGNEVARRENILLPTSDLNSFAFGAMRFGGGNTWTGANEWMPTGADTDYGAKINNISVFAAVYGGEVPVVPPVSVTITPAVAAARIEFGPGSLVADRTFTASAIAMPVNATDRSVTWSSEPAGILNVVSGEEGSVSVTGLAEGSARLIATANMPGAEDAVISAYLTITVDYVAAEVEPMPDFQWLLDQGYILHSGSNFDPANENPTWHFASGNPRPPTGNGDWAWHARETEPQTNHYYRFETAGQAGARSRAMAFDTPLTGSSIHVHFDWLMPTGNVGGVRNAINLQVLGPDDAIVSVRAGQAGAAFEFPGSPSAGWWIAAYSGPSPGANDERAGTFFNGWQALYGAGRLQFLGGPGAEFGMSTQGIWYTVDMTINMSTGVATVTMRPRGSTDAAQATTVEVPFSGTQVNGFAITVDRGPEQNHGLTGQGIDNIFFFTQSLEDDTVIRFIAPDFLGAPPQPVGADPNAVLWQNWFMQVETGATLASLNLPATIDAERYDGTVVTMPVSWEVTNVPWTREASPAMVFNSNTPGVFEFSGTVSDVPGQAYNIMNIVPQMFVEVRTGLLHNYARPIEWLDRGVVAVPVRGGGGNLIQWRLLVTEYAADEPPVFNLYRNGVLIESGLTSTNFVDVNGQAGDEYTVVPVSGYIAAGAGTAVALANNFLEILVQQPRERPNPAIAFGGTPNYPAGSPVTTINYVMNDMSVADVDGDGQYEILVRWTTNMQRDPGLSARHTGETIFDLYTLDGTLLWRINLGINITDGPHHSPFNFFDLDNDGFAELAVKTADGTRVYHPDPETGLILETFEGGTPVYIIGGNPATNPLTQFDYNALIQDRGFFLGEVVSHPGNVWIGGTTCPVRGVANTGAIGRINNGPEFFTVFDGLTGLPIDTVEYFAPYGISRGGWGDANQNRSDRFMAGVAFMPRGGEEGAEPWPTVIEARQHYYPRFVAAYQLIEGSIEKIWDYDWRHWGSPGGGNHQMTVADVNFDGYDDVNFGSVVLDHRGHVLWAATGARGTINVGHGDALHQAPIFPHSNEFYRFSPHEAGAPNNVTLLHGSTGRPVWTFSSPLGDVGRGAMGNITPLPGFEVWASETPVHNVVTGEQIHIVRGIDGEGQGYGDGHIPVNHMVYWSGQLTREFLDGGPNQPLSISKLDSFNFTAEQFENGTLPARLEAARSVLQTFTGTLSNNGTKANPSLQADILGDWREEVLVRRNDNQAFRIYITDFETDYTLFTLMHDPTYRLAVAWQNAVYNQPPHLGFYLGDAVREDVLSRALPTANVRYTIEPESSDASLISVYVSGVAAVRGAGTNNWYVELPHGTNLNALTAEALGLTAAFGANYVIEGSGANWTVTVTSESGLIIAVHTITVTVADGPPDGQPSDPDPGTPDTGAPGPGPGAPGPGVTPPAPPAPTPEPEEELDYELHLAFMFGDPAGNFRPRADITRAEAAAILARTQLLDFERGITELPEGMTSFDVFADVVPGNWFYYYVAWAYDAGLIQGFAGNFRPNDSITRQEFAALLARTTTIRAGNADFNDASAISGWAANYVNTVLLEGWMQGDAQGNFRPADNIIRVEVATAMNRILGRLDSRQAFDDADVENLNLARSFPDVSAQAWYFPSVLGAANDHRLTRTDDGRVDWKDIVIR